MLHISKKMGEETDKKDPISGNIGHASFSEKASSKFQHCRAIELTWLD
jgi:hypothetical protein